MFGYPRVYALLKRAGHSPLRAAQIVLDAARGDERAVIWIRVVMRARRVKS
jgi:hypothetical protein